MDINLKIHAQELLRDYLATWYERSNKLAKATTAFMNRQNEIASDKCAYEACADVNFIETMLRIHFDLATHEQIVEAFEQEVGAYRDPWESTPDVPLYDDFNWAK